ncbi:Probable lactoylglutathione lyase, chloroplastic [Linum grandiflorum]
MYRAQSMPLSLSSSSYSTIKLPFLHRPRSLKPCSCMSDDSGAVPQSYLLGLREGSSLSPVKKALAETAAIVDPNLLDWIKNDKRRMLHVVYYVGDLDKTIKYSSFVPWLPCLVLAMLTQTADVTLFPRFYTECLGMKLLRQRDIPEDKYRNAFLGYGPEESNFAVELTYNPDGYNFELLERKPAPEPLCQVMLRVGNLDRAIDFYKKSTVAYMGYGPEEKNVVLELTYNYGISTYEKGNGYQQIAIGTDDVYKSAEAIKQCGGIIVREPGPLPGINTKITVCLDPDGWKWVFVDNADFLRELE